MPSKVAVDVYDREFRWQGTADTLRSLTATKRHLDISTAEFALDPSSDMRDQLMARAGASVVVSVDEVPFLSGWVTSDGGAVDGESIAYEVTGHDVLGWDVLAWPVPSAPLSGQNVAYYRFTNRPAENAVKEVLQANAADRLGLPVTVAPKRGRGKNITVQWRFHPIMDRIGALLRGVGIGVTVDLVEGQGLRVDCYETVAHTEPWDRASGVLIGGEWKRVKPVVTRVVAGSQGEAADRSFFGPVSAGWETDMLPRVIEGFVDARDIGGDEGDSQAEVESRMQEKLDEGAAEYDLSVELDSTEEFAYGTGWNVGDVVPLQVRDDVTLDARIDEAILTLEGGVRIRPSTGASDDPLRRALSPYIATIRKLSRAYRDQVTR